MGLCWALTCFQNLKICCRFAVQQHGLGLHTSLVAGLQVLKHHRLNQVPSFKLALLFPSSFEVFGITDLTVSRTLLWINCVAWIRECAFSQYLVCFTMKEDMPEQLLNHRAHVSAHRVKQVVKTAHNQ